MNNNKKTDFLELFKILEDKLPNEQLNLFKNIIEDPLTKPFKYWSNLLKDRSKPWIWSNSFTQTCEFAGIIFLILLKYINQIQTLPDLTYQNFLNESKPIFILLNIKVISTPLNIISEITNKWDLIIEQCRNEQMINTNSLLGEWEVYNHLFNDTNKILMYHKSDIFLRMFTCLLMLFKYCSKKYNIKKNKVEILLLARYFNNFINILYQYPEELKSHTFCFLYQVRPSDVSTYNVKLNKLLDKLHSLQQDNKENMGYCNDTKNFFCCNTLDPCTIEHHKWKNKSCKIDGLIWEVLGNNAPLKIEPIIKESNPSLYTNLKYVNLQGWIDCLWESIVKKRRGFNYNESLAILNVLNLWFKYNCDIMKFEKTRLTLNVYSNDINYNYFTKYPKILDLSKNEWCIKYKRRIKMGDLIECIKYFNDAILNDYNGYLAEDEKEIKVKNIRAFVTEDEMPQMEEESDPQPIIPVEKEKNEPIKSVTMVHNDLMKSIYSKSINKKKVKIK